LRRRPRLELLAVRGNKSRSSLRRLAVVAVDGCLRISLGKIE